MVDPRLISRCRSPLKQQNIGHRHKYTGDQAEQTGRRIEYQGLTAELNFGVLQ